MIGILFGAVFAAAGLLFMLLPVIAPGQQGNTPIWLNILAGAPFVIVGFAVIQIQRDARSMPFWAGLMCAALVRRLRSRDGAAPMPHPPARS